MQPTHSKTPSALLAWLATLSAALFFLYCFIQLNLFSPINDHLMLDFNLNAHQLGQLSSMYFYGNALFLFPAGILLDRYSPKKLLLMAVIVTTLGTLLFSLAHNYFWAALARFCVGLAGAFCFLSCIRIASRWFKAKRMALVTGIIVTMGMLGGMIAQTPLALLSSAYGWRQAVLGDAVFGILILVAVLIFVKDRPPGSQEADKADKDTLKALGIRRCLAGAISNPQNWLGGIYTSLLNLPVFLLGALWGIPYLREVHHLSAVDASYATTLFFVGVILGSPAYGWFSDYLGLRRLPMIIGAVFSLAVILCLMFVPSLSLGSLIVLFFLIGFATSSQVLAYPAIAELNPIALTSTSVSIASMSIMLSGVIFQPFFGWLMGLQWDQQVVDGIAVYSAQDFNNAMWIFPGAFIMALLISLMIKETYCRSIEFISHSSLTENPEAKSAAEEQQAKHSACTLRFEEGG